MLALPVAAHSAVARVRFLLLALLALGLTCAAVGLSAQSAAAAVSCANPGSSPGVPAITLTKDQPAEALYATPIEITLRASQQPSPPGAPESGFNLSFRDVLPPGVNYVPGSSSFAPQEIINQPAPGYTTLIFSNVSDLAPGSDFSLTYKVSYSSLDFDAGDTITTGAVAPPVAAGAYVNCNPRWVALFDAQGQPINRIDGHSYTSQATTSTKDTLLKAIEIEKFEPSPEHELLRGVHHNKTAYTLKLTNNTVNPTDNVHVVDYLPAGLEFLGCGTVDNTTSAPTNPGSAQEYPGSGLISAGANPSLSHPCTTPSSVQFGTFDPDGAGPAGSGNYTRVTWDLGPAGNLAANGVYQFSYVAAIPICPNTNSWTGATPTAASLGQTANLDNNSCAGGETTDETALRNYATVTGDYHPASGGPISVSDTDDLTVTAEDLAIWKEATTSDYAVGSSVRWKLHVRTSEYRSFTNVVINDTAPDGTCPVVGTAPPSNGSPDVECAPTGLPADQPIPDWTSAAEQSDGTWDITWALGNLPAGHETEVDFSTKVRTFYQENGNDTTRVLATDPLTNHVAISGNGWPICSDTSGVVPCGTPGSAEIPHTQVSGTPIIDDSEATVESKLPTISKQVSTPVSIGDPADCTMPPTAFVNGTAALYRPGDIVCWKLRVNFPGTVSTGGISITDFLPPGTQYVAGWPGEGATPSSDVPLVFPNGIIDNGTFLNFNLDIPNDTVTEGGHVFEFVIATRITNSVVDPAAELPPIRGNLMKMTSINTAGHVTTYRAEAAASVAEPILAVTKGVKRIAGNPVGGNPANTDGGTIVPGQPVQYRVDVRNTGSVAAVGTQTSERLVGPYDCSMINNITTPGGSSASCTDSGPMGPAKLTIVRWTDVTVPAAGATELNFEVTYPNTIAPGVRIDDIACVDSYENDTNDPFNPRFQWAVPNDPAFCGPQTAPGVVIDDPISDGSFVTAPGGIAKTATTSVNETNNNASTQATVGEEITYTVTATIPSGTTVNNLVISDAIVAPLRQVFVSGSETCISSVAGLCASSTVGFASNTVTLAGPPTYLNTSGSNQTIELRFRVKVADVGTNTAGATLTNTGNVSYVDQYGITQAPNTSATTITVVEPNPRIAKADDETDNIVSAGQEIEYVLTVTNPSRTSPTRPASPSHNSVVTDVVPTGLTPSNGFGAAIADGGTVVRCDGSSGGPVSGVWSLGTRTITWNVGDIAPASTTTLRYCADVDTTPAPSAGQKLINNARVDGTSMPGVVTGERAYVATATDTMTVAGATIAKDAAPTSAPVGKQIVYTVTVTLPANTVFHQYKVLDTLPAGMNFVSFDSTGCAGSCGGVPTPTTGQAGQNLTWDYGSIPSDAAPRTLTIVYTARVANVLANQQDSTLVNSARDDWCTVVTAPCPGGSGVTSTPVNKPITVTEPNLTIDKDVNCQSGDSDVCNVQPGASFTYSITVTNTGNSTAYDALIQDAVPAGLTNVVVSLPGGVTVATPTGGNTQAWTAASIAPGGSVTITYTADLVGSVSLTNLMHVINTAEVTSYWGLDAADRASNPDARPYPEGAKPTDTVDLTVHLPQPDVVKTVANSGNAEIGQPLRWTLTIANNSTVAALNSINVSDVLPTGWVYDAGSTLLGGNPYSNPGISGQTLTWNTVGNIAGGGANLVLSFTAHPTMASLSGGDPANPYVNNVSILGQDASGSTTHGVAFTPYSDTSSANAYIQMPNLTIAKTPNSATVHAGDWSNWTIVVTNSGPGTARAVEIRDAVPANLFYNFATHPLTATCSPSPCDNLVGPAGSPGGIPINSGTGPHTIYWTLDSLAPGQSLTLTLPMFVGADVASGTTYTNNAYAHSTERPTDVTDPGSWTTDRSADLAITKVGTPNPGTAGQNISYTLTATNNGPSTANGVEVHDTINTSQFEFVSITPGNGSDSCTSTGGPPINQLDCTVSGTLGVGASRTFTVVLKVKSGLTGSVSNTATVDGDEPDPLPLNNSSTSTIPLGTTASLAIVKTVSTGQPTSIPNHSQTEFTIVVTNNGPSDALNVTVTDDVPNGLSCVSTTPASVGCPGTAGSDVTWSLGTIVAGDSRTLTMTVRGEAVGVNWNNVATVHSPTDPTDSFDNDTVTVTPMADVHIAKTGPATAASGSNITYTLTYGNNGPDPAAGVSITDTLPPGTTFVSAIPSDVGVTCDAAPALLLSCNVGALAASAGGTIQVTVDVGWAHSEQTIVNNSAITTTTTDTVPSNNHDDHPTDIGPNADVAIVKAGPAFGADGWPLSYTLSVINNGPATAENVVVNDPLPAGLTYQSSATNVGSCTESSNNVTCNLGDMAIGETAQITIVAVPGASVVGTSVTNTVTVASSTPDSNIGNNSDDVTTPIENNSYPTSSNMSLTKTVSNSIPKVGDLVAYTLVATNQGPDTANSAVITDTLPVGLIYSSASGEGQCTEASQVVTCQLGNVPNGASRTVTIQAYVARTGSVVNNAVVNAANDRNPADNSAVSPVTAARSSARISLSKKANKKSVRVGGKVKYTIKVKNISRVNAVSVVVCDRIPSRLTVVSRAGGTLRGGNLCWSIPVLKAGASRTFKPVFRMTNGRGSSVTNSVRASAYNARTARAKAKVRAPGRASRGGGTTG
jgi:uncharacterized repeat protein (TIGR01451 family)/fimbrial isopeptide formation D2 family protein